MTTTAVTCAVSSVAIQSATAEHPKYGASTLLTLPAVALPSSWPLIAGILKESRAVPGDFSAVAGFSKAAAWSISLSATSPPLAASCDEIFYANSSTVQWSSPALPRCSPAVETIAALVASARGLGAAPSLSVAVFGVTHLLLIAGWGTHFPETTTATLGGVPCNVNWVSSDGSVLSVSTPSLSSLCAALGFSVNATDCGTAQLLLSGAPWSTTASTIASVAVGSLRGDAAALSLPISYGPAVAGADWRGTLAAASADPAYAREGVVNADSPFATLASIVSGDSISLTLSSALTPPGIGLRAMAECRDFSPAALCAAAAATSYEPPTNLTCSWGSGDSCEICPLGAQCPGGRVLLARPGWWTPLSASSPPADLKPCPQPDALLRCPGWRNVTSAGAASAMGCGSGYRGVACGACAVGYTPKSGVCVLCPSLGRDKLLAAATPVLIFISCLLFIGASLTLFVKWIGASWGHAVFAAAALSAWFFSAAQSAAAAFTVTQSISPPELEVYYTVLTSLLFKGVSIPPACYEAVPYVDAWIAVVVGAVCLLLGALCAAVIARARNDAARAVVAASAAEDASKSEAPPLLVWSRRLLALCCNTLFLGYGPLTAAFSNALTCSTASAQPIRLYLTLTHDGTTLASALASATSDVSIALAASGAPPASVADFERAFNDPVFAASRRLKGAIDAPLSFSLVLADGFSVCYEGVHVKAWLASAVVGGLVVIGFPLLGLWAMSAFRCVVTHASARRRFHALHATLSSVLADKKIRAQAVLYPYASLILSAVLVGTTSLASRATTARSAFLGLMSLGILAPLAFAAATIRVSPYEGSARWQSSGTVALLLLSSISSFCSIFLFLARETGDTASWAAYVPLVFVFPFPFWIFLMWWRAIAREFAVAKIQGTPAILAHDSDTDDVEVTNPLHAGDGERVDYAPQMPGQHRRDDRDHHFAPVDESPSPPALFEAVADVQIEPATNAFTLPPETEYVYPSTRRAGAISAMDFLPEHHMGPLFDSHRSAVLLGARLVKGRATPAAAPQL